MESIYHATSAANGRPMLGSGVVASETRISVASSGNGVVKLKAGLYRVRHINGSSASAAIAISISPGDIVYVAPNVAQPSEDVARLGSNSVLPESCLVECEVTSTLCYAASANAQILSILRLGDAG